MNTKSIAGAARVICDAMAKNRIPATIAVALDAGGWLNTEEAAAELVRLRLLQNAQPAELTEEQTGALVDAGNAALNDFYIAAVLGRWESMRAPVDADRAARHREELRVRRNEDMALRDVLLHARRPVPLELGDSLVPAVQWLMNRVAELEAAQSQPAPMLDTTTVAASELVRAEHFHDAARLLEAGAHDDDAVNFLDLMGDGIREHADRVVLTEAPAPHFYRLGRDLPEVPRG